MKIRRLTVENFRNLEDIGVNLSAGTVLVGENSSGKSNMLHAIRLVLDSSMSSRQRTLTAEDFSESLGKDPMGDREVIAISIEIDEFDNDAGLLAVLNSAIISSTPLRARLTYEFRPRPGQESEVLPAYEWIIYGGTNENHRISGELRSYLHHVHMQALRDVQADLASWRKSPLRPTLDSIAAQATDADLTAITDAIENANQTVRDLAGIKDTAKEIEAESRSLVGALHRLEPTLDISTADPVRALRSLRLFIDGRSQRNLGSASLGSLNVLYIALLQLELGRLLKKGEIEHALISIEEPEAHVHPHLQRRMFSGLLAQDGPQRSTIVTTHSPHIVSVVPPQNLVLLRNRGKWSDAYAASEANLTTDEWDDLSRYLDATRSELVFARKVLLVEGFAEQVLLPRIAMPNVDFDEFGISVCAVHGTHFTSYVRFLRAIGTPYAVITDGDQSLSVRRTGASRAKKLARTLKMDENNPSSAGIFYGDDTLETDLFDASDRNRDSMMEALLSLPLSSTKRTSIEASCSAGTFDSQQLLNIIRSQKGRFAQRLASRATVLDPPKYIADAIERVSSD